MSNKVKWTQKTDKDRNNNENAQKWNSNFSIKNNQQQLFKVIVCHYGIRYTVGDKNNKGVSNVVTMKHYLSFPILFLNLMLSQNICNSWNIKREKKNKQSRNKWSIMFEWLKRVMAISAWYSGYSSNKYSKVQALGFSEVREVHFSHRATTYRVNAKRIKLAYLNCCTLFQKTFFNINI